MLFGQGLRPLPIGDFMNNFIIDIDKDLADFSQSSGRFLNPLFILNAIPKDESWFNVNQMSSKFKIVGVTSCDLASTARWLDMWEIPVDSVISREDITISEE
jgi:hypothetical protein